jgi:hypothetical protein
VQTTRSLAQEHQVPSSLAQVALTRQGAPAERKPWKKGSRQEAGQTGTVTPGQSA